MSNKTAVVTPDSGESSAAIAPVEERFLTAFVPGAQTLADVLAGWKARGLEPRELTEEQIVQRIVLTHDPRTGTLKWTTQNLDGLGATLMATEAVFLMPCMAADGAQSIAEYFTTGEGQLDLGTGEAAVMIAFKDGRLAIDWTPKDVPAPHVPVKKLLAVALLRLIAEDAGLPIERFLEAFGWEQKDV